MNFETHFGFERWLPRRDALLVALGLWVTGLALTCAVAVRMHHESPASSTNEASIPGTTVLPRAPADATESAGVLVMPEDRVVAHQAPSNGVTLKQKP